ncbi:YwaF family protein [Mycoplasmatota bacterium zrk1]
MIEVLRNFFKHTNDLPINPSWGIKPFGILQLSTAIFCIIIIVSTLLFIKKNKGKVSYYLKLLSGILLSLELSRMIWLILVNRVDLATNLPLHFCYFSSLIICLSVFFDIKFLKSFSFLYIMPMGFVSLFMYDPKGYHIFSFAYIEIYIYHSLLVIIPSIEIVTRLHKIEKKHFIYSVLLFAFIVLIVYKLNLIIGNGADYMYLVTVLNPKLATYQMPFYAFFKVLMDKFSYFGSHLSSTVAFIVFPTLGLLISNIFKRREIN